MRFNKLFGFVISGLLAFTSLSAVANNKSAQTKTKPSVKQAVKKTEQTAKTPQATKKQNEAKKTQEVTKPTAKKPETKKQEAKKPETKKQEAKKQEVKKQESKKQDVKKQEAKKQTEVKKNAPVMKGKTDSKKDNKTNNHTNNKADSKTQNTAQKTKNQSVKAEKVASNSKTKHTAKEAKEAKKETKNVKTSQAKAQQAVQKKPENDKKTEATKVKKYYQTGIASYYAEYFHGRLTANGERFNMNAMTAAHRKLPFGTVVEVTSLRTGKKVVVRINDRGPYVSPRVIDLSKEAARRLGTFHSGIAKVRIDIIKYPTPEEMKYKRQPTKSTQSKKK